MPYRESRIRFPLPPSTINTTRLLRTFRLETQRRKNTRYMSSPADEVLARIERVFMDVVRSIGERGASGRGCVPRRPPRRPQEFQLPEPGAVVHVAGAGDGLLPRPAGKSAVPRSLRAPDPLSARPRAKVGPFPSMLSSSCRRRSSPDGRPRLARCTTTS